jgi:hypothetical protein
LRRVHRGRAFGGRAVGAASEPIVSAFAATDATVYAATDDGVFQSPDGGGTWQAVSAGLADLHVYALALDRSQSSRLRPSRASADAVRRASGRIRARSSVRISTVSLPG